MAEAAPKWWNLDIYLAEIISLNMRDYARNGSGVPRGWTKATWTAKLNSIAERLETYKGQVEMGNSNAIVVKNAQDAVREMAEIFPLLWD